MSRGDEYLVNLNGPRRAPVKAVKAVKPKPVDPFTQVPNALIRDPAIKPIHLAVWVVIRSHTGSGNYALKYATIATEAGCSKRSVEGAVQVLEDCGWLVVQRSPRGRSGQAPNVYKAPLRRVLVSAGGAPTTPVGERRRCAQVSAGDAPTWAQEVRREEEPLEEEPLEEEPTPVAQSQNAPQSGHAPGEISRKTDAKENAMSLAVADPMVAAQEAEATRMASEYATRAARFAEQYADTFTDWPDQDVLAVALGRTVETWGESFLRLLRAATIYNGEPKPVLHWLADDILLRYCA